MTAAPLPWILALAAGLWAALLAVAEEAPTVSRSTGGGPAGRDEVVPLYRALQASRLALLVVAGLGGAVIVEWWARPPHEAAVAGGVGITLFVLVADTLPRGVAALSPRLATVLAPVARRSLLPLRPLLSLVAAVEQGLHILLPPARPVDDAVGRKERDMLASVLALQGRTVEEVMTPRLDIFAIPADAAWRDVMETARRGEHARIPVYRDDLDDIVGILYAKDLAPAAAGIAEPPREWRQLVRPAAFVPESKPLAAQLRDFQRGPAHLAIVVDEFGGTSGLVTLEDVIEEVVGEIRGEYDADEQPEVQREGDDRFWVDGSVSVDELAALLGTPVEREDVSTVGGLIYSELGRVPQSGEQFHLGDFRVVVEKVVRRRVQRVYFERRSTVEAGGGEQGE